MQVDVLSPVAGLHQLLVRVAVHPAIVLVVVGQRIVRRAVAERFAHRDALAVERVRDRAHGGLRALVVDVPALEVLQGRRVHHHQRRMDHRPRVHQRARQRVAAAVHARVGAADHVQRRIGLACRIDAGGQPHGADRHVHLALAVLARQVRQRTGLGPGHVGRVARFPHDAGHHERCRTCPAEGTPPVRPPGEARAHARCRPARPPETGSRSARRRAPPRRCRPWRARSRTSRVPSASFSTMLPASIRAAAPPRRGATGGLHGRLRTSRPQRHGSHGRRPEWRSSCITLLFIYSFVNQDRTRLARPDRATTDALGLTTRPRLVERRQPNPRA